MRVIAGVAKGHKLVAPAGVTRPTTDRVREAVFSGLANWANTGGNAADGQLAGHSLLDLYAGSGAVAIEAASRGANPVVAVDTDQFAVAAIKANATATGLSVVARRVTVQAYLSAPSGPFSIIWLDPPYALAPSDLDKVLAMIDANHHLAPGGLVAIERTSRVQPPTWPFGLAQSWQRHYGETVVYFGQSALKEHQ